MLVVVRLSKVQTDATAHEQRCADESKGRRLAKQRKRKGSADKGSRREVCAGARGSQMPKAQHKEHQAYAIAEEADCSCSGERCGSRQRRATSERQRKIDRSGRQPLDW